MEQNFGLISIIMAAYNAENTIEKAVMSVIAQTYTQFELIIIMTVPLTKLFLL